MDSTEFNKKLLRYVLGPFNMLIIILIYVGWIAAFPEFILA
jgi:hypothetical protein